MEVCDRSQGGYLQKGCKQAFLILFLSNGFSLHMFHRKSTNFSRETYMENELEDLTEEISKESH